MQRSFLVSVRRHYQTPSARDTGVPGVAQKEQKKERIKRQREAAAAESQGLAPPPRKAQKVWTGLSEAVPLFQSPSLTADAFCRYSLQTLENTRAWDETRIQPEDAENAADVADDEFASAFRGRSACGRAPCCTVTTSRTDCWGIGPRLL